MDPLLNCALAVCCPDGSVQQLEALTQFMLKAGGESREEARKYAALILAHFDLAQKGTLTAFKQSVARLAREIPGEAA